MRMMGNILSGFATPFLRLLEPSECQTVTSLSKEARKLDRPTLDPVLVLVVDNHDQLIP